MSTLTLAFHWNDPDQGWAAAAPTAQGLSSEQVGRADMAAADFCDTLDRVVGTPQREKDRRISEIVGVYHGTPFDSVREALGLHLHTIGIDPETWDPETDSPIGEVCAWCDEPRVLSDIVSGERICGSCMTRYENSELDEHGREVTA